MIAEQFAKWMELAENHGLATFLLLYILFRFVEPWIRGLIKKSQDAPGKPNSLIQTIELEKMVSGTLAKVGADMGSQWSTLWQFHNGLLSSSKVPFMRMSVTHEFVSDGAIPRSELYQGIPISVFIDAVTIVERDGFLFVTPESPFPAIVNSYKRDGVGCGAFFRINDNNGNMMGILSISYREVRALLNTEEMDKMHVYSMRLSALLEQMAQVYKHPSRRMTDAV